MMNLYCVYDTVSYNWQPPVAAHTDNEAVRGFMYSCADPRIPESYLSDIKLFCVGTFDENTGFVEDVLVRLVIAANDVLILKHRAKMENITKKEVSKNEIFGEENNG